MKARLLFVLGIFVGSASMRLAWATVTVNGATPAIVANTTFAPVLDAGSIGALADIQSFTGNVWATGRVAAVAAPNDGGTPIVYIEYGRDVLSGSTKTVTFKNAFSEAPACTCTDGTAIAGCDIPISTVSTTQMVVNGTTTDQFAWHCIGKR